MSDEIVSANVVGPGLSMGGLDIVRMALPAIVSRPHMHCVAFL
jgi:hypothetical protein